MDSQLDTQNLQCLLVRHLPLIKRIAYHFISRLPSSVQLDDLSQVGLIALLSAIKKYDASKGASFETYASIRIRGAMLDELRQLSWAPRGTYKALKDIEKAVRGLELKLGRHARDQEIAQALNISINQYHQLLQDCNALQLYGFDEPVLDDDLMNYASSISNPADNLSREKFREQLLLAINGLPEKEKLVLALYYDEELNLKEIGNTLHVSESRVSQIHGQAMIRLRAKLKDNNLYSWRAI